MSDGCLICKMKAATLDRQHTLEAMLHNDDVIGLSDATFAAVAEDFQGEAITALMAHPHEEDP